MEITEKGGKEMKRILIQLGMVAMILSFLSSLALADGNLVQNPGFEIWTAGVPDNWTIWNGEIQQTTDVHSGDYALIVSGYYVWSRIYQDIRVVPGGTYTLSAWEKYPGPSAYTRIEIWWLRADGSIIGQALDWLNYGQSNVYKLFEMVPVTAQCGAAYARIAFVKPGWGLLYVDDVSFTGGLQQVQATVDVKPDTLNIASKSDKNAVTVYIEVSCYDVNNIDMSTVTLSTEKGSVPAQLSPTEVGDYDSDGIPDRMVKFDRQAVIAIVNVGEKVKVNIQGKIGDAVFAGSDEIRVIAR